MPMINEDPLNNLIMQLAGWHMSFKSDDEPSRMVEVAGWEAESSFDDSMSYNRMTIARHSETFLNKFKRTLLNVKCMMI